MVIPMRFIAMTISAKIRLKLALDKPKDYLPLQIDIAVILLAPCDTLVEWANF